MVPIHSNLAKVSTTSRSDSRKNLRRSMFDVRCSMFLPILLSVFQMLSARAADTNAVLSTWIAAQTNIHTWSADVVQTRTLKSLTQPLTAYGHVWFEAPNRF